MASTRVGDLVRPGEAQQESAGDGFGECPSYLGVA